MGTCRKQLKLNNVFVSRRKLKDAQLLSNKWKCIRCTKWLPTEVFLYERESTNICHLCKKQYDLELRRKNREERRLAVLKNKNKLREQVNLIKRGKCVDCGNGYESFAMEFDHRPGENKIDSVSRLNNCSLEYIQSEIKKCDAVCCLCHRRRSSVRNDYTPVKWRNDGINGKCQNP